MHDAVTALVGSRGSGFGVWWHFRLKVYAKLLAQLRDTARLHVLCDSLLAVVGGAATTGLLVRCYVSCGVPQFVEPAAVLC